MQPMHFHLVLFDAYIHPNKTICTQQSNVQTYKPIILSIWNSKYAARP